MKIQSRIDVKVPMSGEKIGRYKTHRSSETASDHISSIRGLTAYHPTEACPPDAVPKYFLGFGMDGRRFVLELDHAELTALRADIDDQLKSATVRRVK